MTLALGWVIDGFSWTMARGSRVMRDEIGGRCILSIVKENEKLWRQHWQEE